MRMNVGAALLLAAAAPGYAQNKEAALFGARENVQQVSLSPDGTHVAFVMSMGARGSGVFVVNTAAPGVMPRPIVAASGSPERLTGCRWSTDTRLVCSLYILQRAVDLIGSTRQITLNRDGSDLKVLSAPTSERALRVAQNGGDVIDWTGDGQPGVVLMTRTHVPQRTIDTLAASSAYGLGVERVDTTTLKRSQIVPPKPMAVEYITDGRGTIRIMATRASQGDIYAGNTTTYLYTTGTDRNWSPLGKVVSTPTGSTGFDPYAVDPALNVAYGFDAAGGRSALYKVSLDGTLRRELVASRPDVDIDALLRIGRQRRVVGVSYVTERRESEFFDPELKRLTQSFNKALPGRPLVTFVDASADESRLLLFAGSDVDPGTYYLYDKASRKLTPLLPARAELTKTTLATVKPMRFPAADGTMIPAYLTLPPGSDGKGLPAIVMPHGGPSARDEWGFDWLSQYFAARGFAVIQPNFRGSAGYGSEWFQKNGFRSWQTAVGDVSDAGRWLVKEGIGDPARLAIVGWSYGGYAALQSAVVDPDLFKAVVAIAPVTDLDVLREQYRMYSNFMLTSDFIGTGPHVASGSPARHAARIKAPVMLVHGDLDQNVAVRASRLMADRLRDAKRPVDYVEFKDLDHQLDSTIARTEMLNKADAFLRAAWKP